MSALELKKDILIKARDRSMLTSEEQQMVEVVLSTITRSTHTLDVTLEDFPINYWRAILDDNRLTPNQRAVVARHVFGMSQQLKHAVDVYESEVSDAVEFGSTLAAMGDESPNCEMFVNGRWYPVIVTCQFLEDETKQARDAVLHIHLSICERIDERAFFVFRDLFIDNCGNAVPRKLSQVLSQFGLRRLQTSSADYNLRLVKAERQARQTGTVMLVSGPVLVSANQYWPYLESTSMGTPECPTKAVVEPELEVEDERRNRYYSRSGQRGASRLPFVRLFSLETKRYVYADIDDVSEYEFDVDSIERLCLPADMLSVLSRVFETPAERIFGDLIRGKHGGVVVLASGNPGVGKTLTAEIYAERTQRPLYVLEMGELGTSAEQVEQHLRTVFARVTRWNAVLQFDECEIFLAQRNDDLERSAIVGIFLRLLDYYQGMLFLTSNRPEVIDAAVMSRVMLRLNYPDLTNQARAEIWSNMAEAAGVEFNVDIIPAMAAWRINGRQIRNLTRLAKMLFPGQRLTAENMDEVRRFGLGSMTASDSQIEGVAACDR